MIDRKIIGRIVLFLDPPSAVCIALTCRRLRASVYNACDTSKLKEICPRDVRSQITPALCPYNIYTGMLKSGAYNIDNLKLCPEVPEPDEVIPLALSRGAAWDRAINVWDRFHAFNTHPPALRRNSYESPFAIYEGQPVITSVEWHILAACLADWMGKEYKYCDKHGEWVKWDQTPSAQCRRCVRTIGCKSVPGGFESNELDE